VNTFRFALTIIGLSLFCAGVQAQPAAAPGTSPQGRPTPPTIEQLAAFPAMSQVSLSPDGQHLVALRGQGEEQVILVWRTDALTTAPTVIRATQMRIAGVQFVKNDTLAVTLWQPYDYRGERVIATFVGKLFFTDLQGRNWREPLPLPRPQSEAEQEEQARTSPTVIDTLPNDPDYVLLQNNVGNEAGDVYRVNVHTNEATRIIRSEQHTAGYITDLQGNIRARLRRRSEGGATYIATDFRPPGGGAWQEHFRTLARDRDRVEVIGFTADPNIALVRSNAGRDKAVIYEYDIAAHAQREIIFQHPYFEAEDVIIQRRAGPTFGEVVGLRYGGPRGDDVAWVSPRYQALDRSLHTALHITPSPITLVDPATGNHITANYDLNTFYDLMSATPDLSLAVIRLEGPNRPPSWYLLRNGQLQHLEDEYPQIDARALGTTSWTYYTARDGLPIPAILTTPNTELCGAGPYRTVIHPHGGPWARDDVHYEFSMWPQLMASRCMAVLRPQYRGSEGFSRRLWLAGDAQWGLRMQDDLDDATRWLIDQHIANPGHVAVFGFSYGGYAAMAASVRPNGLYRCAIAGAGVSDLHRIFEDFYQDAYFREAQASTIDGLSPVEQADHIQIPIMVYHGRRDTTVPLAQSDAFVSHARRSNQPVVYTVLDDYAHGPAWTRAIFGNQLRGIEQYFATGCGQGGL
jgi:dipeptidyl aminopeptidase/acylaminoacyl peptidase